MSAAQIDEKAVFNACRQIGDADARQEYLRLACGDDVNALGRIRQLLRVHDQAGSFLESPAGPSLAPAISERPRESVGSVVGPYRLLEQIGEGGCGIVFMAEQTHPVRRRVALKVIRPGMDSRQVIARFEAERQALALMDHPNIAKVLDAGETQTGQPYFVMELVRGVPITEYCDARHLTPRKRLELFVSACHAVQHAHQKGVIHRDIKPSNVLVAVHDDRPVVKVIDFGVAKATSGQLTDKTLFTGFAQLVGTPLYMSPEQASMSAIDVDTRSDIYSLGVLLYELLTGATPFEKARLHQAAFDEIRRIIREEEPEKPSTRLSTSDALPSLAANRGTEPARLTRLVRGELDWIVMKALEKDRTRRYETANGFAVDVLRYLADEAVLACPPSVGYRLRKFARRNKAALATGAALGAALLVVAGTLGWMARDGAARRGRNAEAVATLLDQAEGALRAEAPDRAALALEAAEKRSADGGAEEFADRLARVRADLALLHELDAYDAFQWTLVSGKLPGRKTEQVRLRAALAHYGISPSGDRMREAAERVTGSLVRDRVIAALDALLSRERSAGLRELLRATDPDPFRDQVRDAMAARDTQKLIALVGQPEALALPARFAVILGQYTDVPVERRQVVLEGALRDRPGDLHLLMTLATLYDKLPGKHVQDRLRWFQAALAADPRNLAALNNLGVAFADAGDKARAIDCYRRVLRREPESAFTLCNLGNALPTQESDEAIRCYKEAIRIAPDFLGGYYGLGFLYCDKRRWDEAKPLLERVLELDQNFALAHGHLGLIHHLRGDMKDALVHYERAVALDSRLVLPVDNLGVAILATGGDVDRAISCFRKAISLSEKYAKAHANLGKALCLQGHKEDGLRSLERASQLDKDDADIQYNLAVTYLDMGRVKEAVAAYERTLQLQPDHGGAQADMRHAKHVFALEERLPQILAGQPATRDERLALAELCYRRSRYCDAVVLYGQAIADAPELIEIPGGHRYGAACCAALGASGRGSGAETLEASERARLRGLALGWLRAELAAHGEVAASAPAAGGAVRVPLQHWLCDPDLASVRDAEALAGLPDGERPAWSTLWLDVQDAMARAPK